MSHPSGPNRGAARRRPARLALAATVLAAVAACGSASPPAAKPAASPPAVTTGPFCQQLVIPAFFYSSSAWARAANSEPPPSDVILDISGMGAGGQPDPHFEALVRQVKAKDITLLGYISTEDGQRPAAQVEMEVRNYKAWYGVTDIFLDRVSGTASEAAYYRQLASFIRTYNTGSSVWLNPGQYPDQTYMSIGDVVMVFEGTYGQYLGLQVPSWVGSYPVSRFAHTVYATPGSGLSRVFKLASSRRAGHVYVTDGTGSNPYDALPSYWSRENSIASGGCSS
jgi:hypothetical protein